MLRIDGPLMNNRASATGGANNGLADIASNSLRNMMQNPGSYQGTPGYRFQFDEAMRGTQRGLANQRGSGNVLAALAGRASGLAAQDYGNEFDRRARLLGQEQQNELGQGNLQLGRDRLGLDTELGRGNLALGNRNADNTRRANDQQYGLGLLGNQSTNQRNAMDYDLGLRRNATDWGLGMANANTNWFNAQSNDWARRDQSNRDWWRNLG